MQWSTTFKWNNFLQELSTPLSIYVQNSSTPLTLDVQFQMNSLPHLQMVINQKQLKENIIQGWQLRVIRSFLQVGFRSQYQLIYLVWLSFDLFWFSWSLTICFFVALYSCVCSCRKMSRKVFYLYLFTFLVLILQFGTTEAPCMWTNEIQTWNKTKTKLRYIQIDHVFYCSI